MIRLYHVGTIAPTGPEIVLRPGPQGAEGAGVYFSEGEPRFSAAEGARLAGAAAVYVVRVTCANGWWRTKSGLARKFGRPRTWHTSGKAIRLMGLQRTGTMNGVPLFEAQGWGWEGR
jgi:hypothetical protein